MKNTLCLLLLFALLGWFTSCSTDNTTAEAKTDEATNTTATAAKTRTTKPGELPPWAKNANIYEVNMRQYTTEGTFNAFEKEIPRLKEMGVDILWLMPIFPISMTNRKATPDIMIEDIKDPKEKAKYLGSPYAVTDYKAVNPEYGTMDDFKSLLATVHKHNMYLILDWVPNHTGWDHAWIKEHPAYYTTVDGKIIPPTLKGEPTDWYDTAELNYENMEMRQAMINDMLFWVNEIGIDGFRQDVSHDVPDDFWVACSNALFEAGEIFHLAEGEVPEQRNSGSYHMDYGWSFHHILNDIAKGEADATDIDKWYQEDREKFTKGFHMHFTSNHDENTWAGTVFDRMGDAHLALAVLASTFDGMPLIYSGQESANKKRLEFFVKDNIEWKNYEYAAFYKSLLELKKENKALWNGTFGGDLVKIKTGKDDKVYAFSREKDGDKVVVIINLTNKKQDFILEGDSFVGEYTNIFARNTQALSKDMPIKLNAWEYLVFSNK